ncbi:MAG: DUF2917 domain-containing protein [Betaproteobacteria bacterium]|jgi:hypothetical protein|nr:DUF2917 domain-containing protein [Betaproteobacteria bacterium]
MQSNEWIVQDMLELKRGGMLRVEDGRRMLVYLWEGSAWLTQDGENRDVMLGAGSWFRIERGGVTLLYALAECRLTLTSPYEERYAVAVQAIHPGARLPRTLYQAQPTAVESAFGRLRAALRRRLDSLGSPAPGSSAAAS